MSYVVNVHEAIWDDVKDARIYYETVSPVIADKFDEALDIALQNLQQQPQFYFNKSTKYRRIRLLRFPYQIVYSITKETVILWCLHHDKSDKKQWKQRSEE